MKAIPILIIILLLSSCSLLKPTYQPVYSIKVMECNKLIESYNGVTDVRHNKYGTTYYFIDSNGLQCQITSLTGRIIIEQL